MKYPRTEQEVTNYLKHQKFLIPLTAVALILLLVAAFLSTKAYANGMTPKEAKVLYQELECYVELNVDTGCNKYQCPRLKEAIVHYDPAWETDCSNVTLCSTKCPCEPAAIHTQNTDGLLTIPINEFIRYTPVTNSITGTFLSYWVFQDPSMVAEPYDPTKRVSFNNTTGAHLEYDSTFIKEGIHFIWIRGKTNQPAADSVHFGIDEQRIGVITFIDSTWSNKRQNSSSRAEISVTPGNYIIDLWMRETGSEVFEIRISSDPNYIPTD